MQDWLAGLGGGQYVTAILWTLAALILLLVVLFVVRLLRGGRNGFTGHTRDRRPRLALGDSIAVDNQRRLVLVRRDDVEHLILTGGPTDLVVEQNIRGPGAVPRPQPVARPADLQAPPPPMVPVPTPVHAQGAAPAPRPEPAREPQPPRVEPAPAKAEQTAPEPLPPAAPAPAPRPPEPTASQPPVSATSQAAPAAPSATVTPLRPREPTGIGPEEEGDEIVWAEMEGPIPAPREQKRESSLEDEMSRLLEDISDERR